MCVCVCVCVCAHSVVADSLQPHGLQSTRLLSPWDFSGKNTGVGCHSLLQGLFPIQRSNPLLLHCRRILYRQALEKPRQRETALPQYGSCAALQFSKSTTPTPGSCIWRLSIFIEIALVSIMHWLRSFFFLCLGSTSLGQL